MDTVRYRCVQLAVLFAIFVAFRSANAEPAPFLCPIGMERKSTFKASARFRSEWCLDVLGRKNGPFRITNNRNGITIAEATYLDGKRNGIAKFFDPDGALQTEALYNNDEEVSTHIPPAAMRKVISELNAEARKSGKQQKISLVDDRTLGYEYTKPFFWSWLIYLNGREFTDRARDKLTSNPEFCSTFDIDLFRFERVQLRYVNEKGEKFFEMTIQKDECAATRTRAAE